MHTRLVAASASWQRCVLLFTTGSTLLPILFLHIHTPFRPFLFTSVYFPPFLNFPPFPTYHSLFLILFIFSLFSHPSSLSACLSPLFPFPLSSLPIPSTPILSLSSHPLVSPHPSPYLLHSPFPPARPLTSHPSPSHPPINVLPSSSYPFPLSPHLPPFSSILSPLPNHLFMTPG